MQCTRVLYHTHRSVKFKNLGNPISHHFDDRTVCAWLVIHCRGFGRSDKSIVDKESPQLAINIYRTIRTVHGAGP